jgi:D-aspartate ligase
MSRLARDPAHRGYLRSDLGSATPGFRRRTERPARPDLRRGLAFDVSVPAVILKVGKYPVASGALAAIRTLGRTGAQVYALTEPGLTPAGTSRYCAGRFAWQVTERDEMKAAAEELRDIGRMIGARSVIVPMDDESAVLVAEHADRLSEYFLFPPVERTLPRSLASKAGLRELCDRFGVPAPVSAAPHTEADASRFAAAASFPLVVKRAAVWDNRNPTGSSVGSSSSAPRLVHGAEELLSLGAFDGLGPAFVVQEYIPPEHAEDWIVHLYADAQADCRVLFTGRKIRSWPPVAGVTACGVSAANPVLAHAAEQFCKAVGYSGIADMDWRLDRRDGQYKLLDFNPRVGNNFRLFTTESGLDVVHALHLDLTGRPFPRDTQADGRRLIVEHIDIPARLAHRTSKNGTRSAYQVTSTEYAWLAVDDPLPFLAMLSRVVSIVKIIRTGIRSMRSGAPRRDSRGRAPMS